MAHCEHCGTEFSAKNAEDLYCCRGCEYVADLISEQGFERFYDLKQGLALAPVKSRPFEEHDFSWLAAKVAQALTSTPERWNPPPEFLTSLQVFPYGSKTRARAQSC